jgi:hypothetical protein
LAVGGTSCAPCSSSAPQLLAVLRLYLAASSTNLRGTHGPCAVVEAVGRRCGSGKAWEGLTCMGREYTSGSKAGGCTGGAWAKMLCCTLAGRTRCCAKLHEHPRRFGGLHRCVPGAELPQTGCWRGWQRIAAQGTHLACTCQLSQDEAEQVPATTAAGGVGTRDTHLLSVRDAQRVMSLGA